MSVSIVIPNWNGKEKLERNLPRVLKVEGVDEVVIVDDASTDDSVRFIKDNYPQIKLVEKQKNTGFGSTVNLGVKNTKGDFVFLVNSDAVPEEKAVVNILKNFEDPKVFSVGLNSGGNWSWARFKDGFFWHYMAPLPNDSKKEENIHPTLWSSGGSAIFKKSVWDQLGGFDPLYDPFYVEDVDLGYRAWKRGFTNLWDPKVYVEHYQEIGVIAANFSKQKIQNTNERNSLIFTWKNITSPKLFRQHLKALILRLIIHPKYWKIFLAAVIKLPAIFKKRQVEKLEQKVTDEQILERYSY